MGIEAIESAEARRFQLDVEMSRLNPQLGADRADLIRLRSCLRVNLEDQHAQDELLAESIACLSAVHRETCQEEDSLTQEVHASEQRSNSVRAELLELKMELSNLRYDTHELARYFKPRRFGCCSRRRQYTCPPPAAATCSGVPPVAIVIAHENI